MELPHLANLARMINPLSMVFNEGSEPAVGCSFLRKMTKTYQVEFTSIRLVLHITFRLRNHTRAKTLQFVTNRPQDVRKNAKELLTLYMRLKRKIRLIGVRVSTFVSSNRQQTLA